LYELRLGNATLDFWTEPARLGRPVDIRVSPAQRNQLLNDLEGNGVQYSVWINDVQERITQELVSDCAEYFTCYHTYSETVTWMQNAVSKHPTLATLFSIGQTYQMNTQTGIKITSPKGGSSKRILWIDGNIHAREWITSATVIYMVDQLLSKYDTDPEVTQILDTLEIHILPVANPDGYIYTHTTARMWRKTRTPNAGSTCIGTDPNRNWDFQWGGAGVSRDPCSDMYLGNAPFSQPSVLNIAKYLQPLQAAGRLIGFLSFHSYSQLWMTAWAYTLDRPADYGLQNALSAASVKALTAVYGTRYEHGSIAQIIYPASGSSVDWVYGTLKVIQSAGVELRDIGQYGFLLPPSEIVPSGIETFEALKVYAKALF